MAARLFDSPVAGSTPEAPSHERWLAMSEEERRQVVASLPAWAIDGEMAPPEGDPHRNAKMAAFETLREHFRQAKRRIYLAADLMVYYPAKPRFAPDLLAVTDVDDHDRNSWIVDHEGKGIDLALEIHVAGDARKDLERNVPFYASLGISEYFIYDYGRQRLTGYRLRSERSQSYQPILPQGGFYTSEVLGLQLRLEAGRLRFYEGNALLLETSELLQRANSLVQQIERRAEEREAELARQIEAATQRAQEEARRAEEAERKAAELAAELERLKRGR